MHIIYKILFLVALTHNFFHRPFCRENHAGECAFIHVWNVRGVESLPHPERIPSLQPLYPSADLNYDNFWYDMYVGHVKSPDVTIIDVWLARETCKLALFNVVLRVITVQKSMCSLYLARIGPFAQSRLWSCLQKLKKRPAAPFYLRKPFWACV